MLKKASLALAFAFAATLACAAPTLASHNLRIVNAGSHAVQTINISGVNRRMWGADLLGNNYLFPGQSARRPPHHLPQRSHGHARQLRYLPLRPQTELLRVSGPVVVTGIAHSAMRRAPIEGAIGEAATFLDFTRM